MFNSAPYAESVVGRRFGETMITDVPGQVDTVVDGSAGNAIRHPPRAVASSTAATAFGQTRWWLHFGPQSVS